MSLFFPMFSSCFSLFFPFLDFLFCFLPCCSRFRFWNGIYFCFYLSCILPLFSPMFSSCFSFFSFSCYSLLFSSLLVPFSLLKRIKIFVFILPVFCLCSSQCFLVVFRFFFPFLVFLFCFLPCWSRFRFWNGIYFCFYPSCILPLFSPMFSSCFLFFFLFLLFSFVFFLVGPVFAFETAYIFVFILPVFCLCSSQCFLVVFRFFFLFLLFSFVFFLVVPVFAFETAYIFVFIFFLFFLCFPQCFLVVFRFFPFLAFLFCFLPCWSRFRFWNG